MRKRVVGEVKLAESGDFAERCGNSPVEKVASEGKDLETGEE